MDWTVLVGRILFASLFIQTFGAHINKEVQLFAMLQLMPLANLLIPLSGIVALVSGMLILFGYQARLGAWMLVMFYFPVAFLMHRFWGIPDLTIAYIQKVMFMKNVALLGATLMIAYFGSGPYSMDNLTAKKK